MNMCTNKVVAELNKSIDKQSYPERFFSEFTLNQKHNLFIRLNRSFIFTKFISRVISSKECYGQQIQTDGSSNITIVHHAASANLSVSEARTLLTIGLLKNALISIGESVNVCLLVSVFVFAHASTLCN